MKKVYLSDMHIGDGYLKDDFLYDDEFSNLLDDFSTENDIELFIVGDGFEFVQTEFLKNLNYRYMEEIEDAFDPEELINSIEKTHPKVFNSLRKFAKKHNVTYIVGNHDGYLLFSKKLREKLKEKIGGKFEIKPYYYDENWDILIIHGNQFESINRFSKENGKTLPPFTELLEKYMAKNFDENLRQILPDELLSEYDNLTPYLEVFKYFEYITKEFSYAVDLKKRWLEVFIGFVRSEEAKHWLKVNYPKMRWTSYLFVNRIGGIKLGEAIVKLIMTLFKPEKRNSVLRWVRKVLEDEKKIPERFFEGYESIKGIPINNIQGIITGHTHVPRFDIIINKSGVRKFYANSGSWKSMTKIIQKGIKTRIIKREIMSYIVINEENKKLKVNLVVKDLV